MIEIRSNVVVSYGTQICTPSHDYTKPSYPLISKAIIVCEDCWIMAQAFVCPGVTLGRGTVVAARSVVTKSTQPFSVVAGNPARFIKERVKHSE